MSSTAANLRKAGQLNEAYRLAEERQRLVSDDIWAKRDVALLYDLAKKYSTNAVKKQFLKCMSQCRELQMPVTKALFHDKIISLVKAMAFEAVKSGCAGIGILDSLFSCLQGLNLKRKAEQCSVVMQTFLRSRIWRHGIDESFCWRGFDSMLRRGLPTLRK